MLVVRYGCNCPCSANLLVEEVSHASMVSGEQGNSELNSVAWHEQQFGQQIKRTTLYWKGNSLRRYFSQ